MAVDGGGSQSHMEGPGVDGAQHGERCCVAGQENSARHHPSGAYTPRRRPRNEVCSMCLCKMAATAVARPAKWHLGRVRACRHFRKNKGFKGLLIDLGNWLKGQLHDYIEEESPAQNLLEEAPNDDDDDDPFKALEDVENPSKMHTWGHRVYQAMKRIVED